MRRVAWRCYRLCHTQSRTLQKVRSPVGTIKRLIQNDVPPVLLSSYADELRHTAEVGQRVSEGSCGRSYLMDPSRSICRSKPCSWQETRHTRSESMMSGDTRKRGGRRSKCLAARGGKPHPSRHESARFIRASAATAQAEGGACVWSGVKWRLAVAVAAHVAAVSPP